MTRKISLMIFALVIIGLLFLAGMRSQPVQADIPPTATDEVGGAIPKGKLVSGLYIGDTVGEATFLPVVIQQKPPTAGTLLPLRAGSGRLLSFATTSWEAVLSGGDLTYSSEAFVFDLLATQRIPPDPSPSLYFVSRLYLEFELPAEILDDARWVNLILSVCETSNSSAEEPIGFTVHQGTWSLPLNQENSAVVWGSWSPTVLTAQTDVALGEKLIVPLPSEVLQTGDTVRLVLRVMGEENHPAAVWRTCFIQEQVALELLSSPKN